MQVRNNRKQWCVDYQICEKKKKKAVNCPQGVRPVTCFSQSAEDYVIS